MTLSKELQAKAERAKRKRRDLKRVVNAAKHALKANESMVKMKRRPALLNLEIAYDGNIMFDIDLEDYPELNDEVLALCERIRDLAQSRIEGAEL